MMLLTLWTLTMLAVVEGGHDANPVLTVLQQQGLAAPEDQPIKLPEFTMRDGLSAREQVDLMKRLGGRQYPLDEFVRKSRVAPEIYQDVDIAGKNSVYRRADFWFVAYGELDSLKNKNFLQSLLGETDKKDAQETKEITAGDLSKRGVELTFAEREGLGYATVNIMEKVDLSITGWSCWSETEESLVVAAMSDPRFNGDAEFPNRWRPARVEGADPQPYEGGVAVYLKMTRLQIPRGALFIEGHLVLTEPGAWGFGNQLSSKLRIAVQNQVRSLRLQLDKAAADNN